jgi:transketolase
MDDLRARLGRQLRIDAIRCSTAAGSGHPTSSLSAADLMAVLLDGHLRTDFTAPGAPANDHLVFSKGHATPLLYAMWRAVGIIDDEELLSYRARGSLLEGHPVPVTPHVDVATGSLGQGLPIGVGLALAARRLEQNPLRVWVLAGDGELAEGSMWEAFLHAGHEQLDNLTVIVDVNRLGQTGPTRFGWDLDAYVTRIAAFGWETFAIDGHDLAAIDAALSAARAVVGRPTAIIARTVKGSGAPGAEDRGGMHGRSLDDPDDALTALGAAAHERITVRPHPPHREIEPTVHVRTDLDLPTYRIGELHATRRAYAEALVAVARAHSGVVALDAEVGNSTYAELFAAEFPERYFEMYIAEQQMAAAAVGLQVRGWIPFASTFSAFWHRAFDFVRMAAISRADIRLSGSHAGVSIGPDGPSQMALEDLATMRAVWGSTVLYPCDANQTARLVARMVDLKGVSFLRTTRGATPVLYDASEDFPIGGSRTLLASDADRVTIVAAGVTVHEALRAAGMLVQDGVAVRVIDCYSVKPLDVATLRAAAERTGHIVTVEDHRPEGGLGEAVLSELAAAGCTVRARRLAVRHMPGSATPEEQLADAGIDADAIVAAVRELLAG